MIKLKPQLPIGVILIFTLLAFSCSKQEKTAPKLLSADVIMNAALVEKRAFGKISLNDNSFSVPTETIRAIAANLNGIVPDKLKLSNGKDKLDIEQVIPIPDNSGETVIYIVNYTDNNFAIFSADERCIPLLAVVPNTKYVATKAPPGFYKWLENSMDFIAFAKSNSISTKDVERSRAEWKKITQNAAANSDKFLRTNSLSSIYDTCTYSCPNYPDCMTYPDLSCGGPEVDPCAPSYYTIKGPYIETTWGQGCGYNEGLFDKGCTGSDAICATNTRPPTGCVPTAMAQILKYWAHPGSPILNYASMPLHSGDFRVQWLMASAGSSLSSIHYDCEETGAVMSQVPGAMKSSTFGFTNADHTNYTLGSYTLVKANLNSGMPVMLGGCREKILFVPVKCHAWVCDGYYESGDQCYGVLKFHMNWGWDGQFDGWYDYSDWTPIPGRNYQYGLELVYNMLP